VKKMNLSRGLYLAKNIEAHLRGCCHGTLTAEDVIPVPTGRTGIVRHVLHQPQYAHAALAKHGHSLACINQRQVLHPTAAIQGMIQFLHSYQAFLDPITQHVRLGQCNEHACRVSWCVVPTASTGSRHPRRPCPHTGVHLSVPTLILAKYHPNFFCIHLLRTVFE